MDEDSHVLSADVRPARQLMRLRTIARLTRLVLAGCILTCLPLVSEAGDVFTGFQIDNKNQYFGYLGVRTPILGNSSGSGLFVQAMTSGLGYSFKSNGQLLDANIQSIVPSLGISQRSVAGHSPPLPALSCAESKNSG